MTVPEREIVARVLETYTFGADELRFATEAVLTALGLDGTRVIVPVEPSLTMVRAGCAVRIHARLTDNMRAAYRAMISAASQ